MNLVHLLLPLAATSAQDSPSGGPSTAVGLAQLGGVSPGIVALELRDPRRVRLHPPPPRRRYAAVAARRRYTGRIVAIRPPNLSRCERLWLLEQPQTFTACPATATLPLLARALRLNGAASPLGRAGRGSQNGRRPATTRRRLPLGGEDPLAGEGAGLRGSYARLWPAGGRVPRRSAVGLVLAARRCGKFRDVSPSDRDQGEAHRSRANARGKEIQPRAFALDRRQGVRRAGRAPRGQGVRA
jgi:hypothetical protein